MSKWYFVATTINDNVDDLWYFYIFDEDNFITSGSSSFGSALITIDTSDKFCIGGANSLGWTQTNCDINALGRWNRVLSQEDVVELWNNGLGMSYSNLSTAQKVSMNGYFDCDDWDGTNLYDNNGVQFESNGTGTITSVAV